MINYLRDRHIFCRGVVLTPGFDLDDGACGPLRCAFQPNVKGLQRGIQGILKNFGMVLSVPD